MSEPHIIDITDRFDAPAIRAGYIVIDTPSQTPVIGGCRIINYDDKDITPREDAKHLARAMTHKTGAAGVDLGGGKAVIDLAFDDDEELEARKTPELFRTFGRAVDDLDGRYITAEDMNTTTADMDIVAEVTDHVVGLSEAHGGLGDPSPVTAHGIRHGMQACLEYQRGDPSLADTTIVVQGAGKVGQPLIADLIAQGASVKVSELNDDRIATLHERLPADAPIQRVPADTAHEEPCDILAPCGFSEVISPDMVPDLECDIIAGAANNMLIDEHRCAQRLSETGILYAPDFVINGGGLIAVIEERRQNGSHARARTRTEQIGDRLQDIFATADNEDITTVEAAKTVAEQRLKH